MKAGTLNSLALNGGRKFAAFGNRRQFLDEIAVLALLLDHGRGDHLGIAEEAAGRLLGPDPLGEFAGTQIEALHRDAVFGFERLQDRHEIRRAQRHVVDDDLAFLLGGRDHLVPSCHPALVPDATAKDRSDSQRGTP